MLAKHLLHMVLQFVLIAADALFHYIIDSVPAITDRKADTSLGYTKVAQVPASISYAPFQGLIYYIWLVALLKAISLLSNYLYALEIVYTRMNKLYTSPARLVLLIQPSSGLARPCFSS